jgi:uncharacterized protein YigE (DUF2233 family)
MCPRTGSLLGVAVAAVITAVAAGAASVGDVAEDSSLAVRDLGGWTTWWRSGAAPAFWKGDPLLDRRVSWHPGAAGIEWGEVQLRGSSEAWRTRVIVVRIDPKRVTFSLVPAFTRNASWTIAHADSTAALALDAGQFRGRLPWGWVVTRGQEVLVPQYAPLGGAVLVDSSGGVRIVAPDSVGAERERGGVLEAFQSYPMLLMDGSVPAALREAGSGVDLTHRDARLALGTLKDGRVIVALTRFDALGPSLGRVPFGLTTPEMAAVMGGLGASNALLLDGGISGQLLLRTSDGGVRSWPGSRGVPLGLEARSRY